VWKLPGEKYLAEGGVGAVPWTTLMHFDGPPEAFLGRCAEKIEREAIPQERADLLAVAQVLTGLRFPDLDLIALFGGKKSMIESPLLQKMLAERIHDLIFDSLKARFGTIPRDVARHLRAIIDDKKLRELNQVANNCPSMEAFREALLS
jgi:hypothetical protein